MPSTPSDNFDFQNFYSTTLTSDITAGTLTIPVSQAPTPSEGILVIDPDSASPECIFYTSKGASSVTVPADGRGWESTTAASHLSGTTVIMAPTAYQLRMLKTGSLFDAYATGWVNSTAPATITCNGNRSYDLVISGVDLTDTLSAGMRLRTTRTVAAPTQCADLEAGSSQGFTVTNATGLATGTTWTFKVKFKPESYAAMTLIAIDDATNRTELRLNASGQVVVAGGTTAAEDLVTSYQSVALGKWQDITGSITIGTPTGEIRIDDTVVPSFVTASAATTMTISGDEEIYIGRNAAGNYADGKICQAAIFNAIISDATLKGYSSQTMTGAEASCEGFWSLNNTLADLSANGNTLVAGGGAAATATDSPFGGQADGTISSTLDYAEIVDVTFSTNTTVTVRVPEGNTIPTSGGVSAVSYSTQASPYGFPGISNVLGLALLCSTFTTTSGSAVQVNGLSVTVTIPTGNKKIKVTAFTNALSNASNAANVITIWDGTVGSGTQVQQANLNASNLAIGQAPSIILSPASGSKTYNVGLATSAGTASLGAAATYPTYLSVELV